MKIADIVICCSSSSLILMNSVNISCLLAYRQPTASSSLVVDSRQAAVARAVDASECRDAGLQ